jgi:predicted Zn finger-like uncharacterized protein
MKITCERCSAQYDLDESRIPPSGMMMKCPACLHSFAVRRQGSGASHPGLPAMPPPPPSSEPPKRRREIEVSTFADDEGPTVLPPPTPGMIALDDPDEIDLPAPKDYSEVADLPAPREGRQRTPSIPPPRQRIPSIPPPRQRMPSIPPPAPFEHDQPPGSLEDEHSFSSGPLPGLGPDDIDLPAPVDPGRRQDIIDLPAPKTAGGQRSLSLADENIDLAELPAPKERGHQVGISLDAPDPEDLELHDSLSLGAPELELDAIDVVAPRQERPPQPPQPRQADRSSARHETYDVAPRQETTDVAPRQETLDVAPRLETQDVAPRLETHDIAPRAARPAAEAPERPRQSQPRLTKAQAAAQAKAESADDDAESRRRWPRIVAALGGVVLLLGGVGVALGVFTGFGQKLLRGGSSARQEQQLNVARNQMTDDTLGAYRKAAAGMKSLLEVDPSANEAAGLGAQAMLGAAHLGVTAELRNADAQLAKISDEKAGQLPDVLKAKALRSSVAGQFADARTKLNGVLAKAPADSAALVYLGWTELAAGDPAAADHAFAKALAVEASRAQALYGDGVAKERLGDLKGAGDLYQRAQARSPLHLGAAVGLARTTKPPAEAQTAVEQLIQTRTSTAAPRELADAWATVGVLAERQGRHDEAEDRLKRALVLDPDQAIARVALANVQCELKRCADAVAPMAKLVAAQPKNVDAKLALAQAQLGTGAIAEAAATLGAAATLAPKAADVLLGQARLALAQPKIDREGALAKLKDAIAADPRLIPAYILESTTLGALGRDDDAVAALQAAEKQAADSADLMTELGDAYLTLGKPTEAETRYRMALGKTPEARPARMALGAALEAQNKLDDARAEYARVAKDDPQYPGVTERLARLAAKQGHKTEAAQLFDNALKEGVPTQALRLAAAQLFLDPAINRRDDALKLAESVTREDDRSAQGHLLVARAHLEANHFDDALPEARRAAILADLPEAHLILGKALESMAKLDQSINEYGLARRAPVEAEASLGRARILVRMGATKDALTELTTLAKDPKLRAPALLLSGDCYADLQQPDRARHAYEDAVKAAPNSADAAFKLGRALHDAGRRHDAILQLERAVKLDGEKATWAAEADLLLGDAHREGHENDAAVRAYKRYLEIAPMSAPERIEVQKHINLLGGR